MAANSKDELMLITDGFHVGYVEPSVYKALEKVVQGDATHDDLSYALHTPSSQLTKKENDAAHRCIKNITFGIIYGTNSKRMGKNERIND